MLVPYGYQSFSFQPGSLSHHPDLKLSSFVPEMMACVPAVMFLMASTERKLEKTALSTGLNTENGVRSGVGCADTLA